MLFLKIIKLNIDMRKQYHFRPSAKGYYVWDVDKLVEQTKGFPVINLPLSEIKTDKDFWTVPSCKSFAEHMKLVEETSLEYPIILSEDNRVMDGLHRVIKAHFNGDKEIKAVRFDKLPEPDYVDVQEDDLPYD
jgi:hypothetical protein